jgi:hypothetical protein
LDRARSKLFPNSADADLEVHHWDPHDADVTEGSRVVWERLHYDWSDPNHVNLRTTDFTCWRRIGLHLHLEAATQRNDRRRRRHRPRRQNLKGRVFAGMGRVDPNLRRRSAGPTLCTPNR